MEGDAEFCAFTYTVTFEDGGSTHFSRRERPHLVMNGNDPIALTTAVTYRDDASFTLLQPIGQSLEGPAFIARGLNAPPRAKARPANDSMFKVDGCHDPGGNTLSLSMGARTATLSRTGLEGLMGYDDSKGNRTSYNHDDFLVEVVVSTDTQGVVLASAQDSNSHRNCSLMAASCNDATPRATFVYRCVQRWQVLVEYELSESHDFVTKRLTPCRLTASSSGGGRKVCDLHAKVGVIREVLWDGLHRL